MGDIDFIVERDFFIKTVTILKNNGYESNKNLNGDMHWHYPRLTHLEEISAVEVHKKILKDDFQYFLDINLFDDIQLVNSDIRVLSAKNKLLATTLPKIINDNLYHKKIITLRNGYDVFLISKLKKIDLSSISNVKINKKLNNYLSCIKILFADAPSIIIKENSSSQNYRKNFEKLLDLNQLEQKKVQLTSYFFKTMNRFEILRKAFKNKVYRRHVFQRIFQLDFYKMLLGIKRAI